MIKLLLDLAVFLMDYVPLLTSLLFLTLIFVWLSKSIKRHAAIYYLIFAIPLLLCVTQFVLGLSGVGSFRLGKLPVLGDVMRAYTHMAGFGFPLLIIIMYAGALSPKIAWVGKLMMIRKELSILSGFPVLAHSLIRVYHTFPKSVRYFFDHSGYMAENDWVKSDLGVGISNFGYMLGILMVVLFLVLWVTSFDSVHRRMGSKKWKKVQKWSYVFYAMLFVHSVTLHAGWLIDYGMGSGKTEYIVTRVLAIASTLLVFGSYLVLRLKKAKAAGARQGAKGLGVKSPRTISE